MTFIPRWGHWSTYETDLTQSHCYCSQWYVKRMPTLLRVDRLPVSAAVMLHSSHSAMLILYTITSSGMDKKSSWCAFSSAVPQADGPEKEQASIGIANDSTHLLYKAINAAISLFNNNMKRQTTPPQLHSWLDCCVRRKWRQAYDRMPNVEIFILTNDRDAIISIEGRLVP